MVSWKVALWKEPSSVVGQNGLESLDHLVTLGKSQPSPLGSTGWLWRLVLEMQIPDNQQPLGKVSNSTI